MSSREHPGRTIGTLLEADVVWLMTPEAPDIVDLLAELVHRPAWQQRAACRGMCAEVFIVEPGQRTEAARAVCASCPVRRECRDFAVADAEIQGTWGGTSAKERREMRTGRRAS